MGSLVFLGRLDDFLQVLRPFRPEEGQQDWLQCSMNRSKYSFNSCFERWTLCCKPRRVRMLKKHSIRFIQETWVER